MGSEESKAGDGASGQPDGSESSPLTPRSSRLTPHRIRLGPPWQVSAVAGTTRHARKFGRPRTLDANERLWLVCEHVPGPAEVRLNDQPLAAPDAPGPFAADITSLLRPRNEVVFAVASELPLGAVALEVRAS